jgi:hypothetical protein
LSDGEDLSAEGAEINPTVVDINSAAVTAKKDVVASNWYRNLIYVEDLGGAAFQTYYDIVSSYTYERNNVDPYTSMPQDPVEATLQAPTVAQASTWAEYSEEEQDVLVGGGLLNGNVLSGGSFNNFGGYGF